MHGLRALAEGPIGRLLRRRRPTVWSALLAALAIVLCFVPLFDVLGFELAFALALPASLAAADLGAFAVRQARLADRPSGGALAAALELARRAIALGLVPLLSPLVIITLNALRVRNCDPLFGLVSYLALPVVSVAILAPTGVALGLLAGERRRLSNALPYLVALAIALGTGWQFYGEPPVFLYNALIGYFPGNLYDEDIALGLPLLWSRLYQAASALALLAAVAALFDRERLVVVWRRPVGRLRPIAVAALAAGLALTLRLNGGRLGFAVTTADIADFLGGRHESEHFTIYYPPGGEIGDQIELIAADHEFRLAQVVRFFGLPPPTAKITSFYFATADDKARHMGAKNVYMAKPWRREIYLHHADFPHPVVRHELAHVLAGEFGDPLFHVSIGRVAGLPLRFNVGMIEGIAVAADWPDHFDRALTPHESVKAMRELGLAPPVERLLSTGFFAFSSARSYTVAGSLLHFLYETRGVEKLRALYRTGGDFAAAYGEPAAGLLREWSRMIDGLVLPPGAAEVVRERFRRPSIFARPCPHAVAKLRRLSAARLKRGKLADAIAAMRSVCDLVPGEPSYLLDLAELEAEAGRDDEAAAAFARLAVDPAISSTLRASAAMELATLKVRAGDRSAAQAALDAAGELPLDDDLARNVAGRRFALAHRGPAGEALATYFFGDDPPGKADAATQVGRAAAVIMAEPDLGLGHYLYGRTLAGHALPAESVRALSRALDLGLPDPRIERACATSLAELAYAAGDDAALERAIAIMTRVDQPSVTRLYGDDFRERLAWRRARPRRSR